MVLPKFDYLWQYVEYWAEVDPDFPSLRFGNKTISAAEFNQTVRHLAQTFIEHGVKKGDRIVTILPSCPEYVFTYLAANRIGAIVAPLDVRFREAEYRRFIGHVEPKIVILKSAVPGNDIARTIQALSMAFDPGIRYFIVGENDLGTPFESLLARHFQTDQALAARQALLNPEDGALIIFTGGTTGVPKAALLPHRHISSASYLESEFIIKCLGEKGVSGRIKMTQNLPPSHVGGTIEILSTCIIGGWEQILQEDWHPYTVLETIQTERLALIGGVPTMYAILLSLPDLDRFDLSSLQLAITSGEKVSLELLQGIRAKICGAIANGYGSTETGPETTFTDPSDPIELLADGYVGKPLPGQELKIVDENDHELPAGKPGEILTRGSCSFIEYYKMPDETKAMFTPDGWCRSGDLGYLTEDGGLYIQGRIKQIIRVGSYTVLPTEIEEVVIQHPKVALAAVIGMPDKILGEVVWLVVSPQAGQTVSESELIELCRSKLADFKVPKKVIVQASLPMTRIGKVDRLVVRKEVMVKSSRPPL